ncbi:MAG: hypothetical protein IJ164_04600 [Duodenibacillus sp.]|nr:hypothetical protein [Duodenibacillus sp.]
MQTYSLNFRNYSKASQTLDTDGLYWINVERSQDAFRLVLSIAGSEQPVLLFTDTDHSGTIRELGCADRIRRAPVEVIAIQGNCRPISELARALCHIGEARDRLVVAILDSERTDEFAGPVLRESLQRLYRYVNSTHGIVLILSVGRLCPKTQHELIESLTRFRGMSTLENFGAYYRYEVNAWRTRTTIRGESITYLTLDGATFSADASQQGEFSAVDEGIVYTSVNLFGADHERGALQRLCANNREVFEAAAEAVSATVVFTIDDYSELREVARMVHDLRISRGRRLKIAVLEQKLPLKAISESLLLDCGANTVLKPKSGIGYQQVMVANLSRQLYTHDVSPDFDATYRELELSQKVGYLQFQEFVDSVTEIISQPGDRRNEHGALVVLRPKPGLDAAETMMQFAPKRSGDIGTVAGTAAVLYLYGCQETLLGTVLRHIFPVEPHMLFSQYSVAFADQRVREIIEQMRHGDSWYTSGYISEHRQSMLEFAHRRAMMISPDADRRSLSDLVRGNPVVPRPVDTHVKEAGR